MTMIMYFSNTNQPFSTMNSRALVTNVRMAKETGKDVNAQEDAAKVKYTFRDIYD